MPLLNRAQLLSLLGLTVLIASCCAIWMGAAALPLTAWFCDNSSCQGDSYILWQIRLPRVCAALLIGASLAISGAAMQGMFRNPLVDSGIIGVSSGADLAAALYIVLLAHYIPTNALPYALPIAAFLGSWGVTFALYRLSHRHGQLHIAIMLLIGIALAALTGAVTGLLIYVANDNQLRDITFWSMGSLASINWKMVVILSIVLIGTVPIMLRNARALNALSLGEASALHMGFTIQTVKKRLIICVALQTGSCVAFAGSIGFIGLVVPHLIRLLGGSDHRSLLPASLLGGAALLTLADTLSRTLISPAELPIGILTSLFGVPFLGLLVWKSGTRYD
ncbi:MAG: iron ABC transporter permease [Cardiobacteriaceae bacterium]|nr:iron ABC transporter permease [Cardiobacteriaceae bacterium]